MIQGFELIVSPALAGLLLGAFGLGAIFIADFVTFGASIVALLLSAFGIGWVVGSGHFANGVR